VADTNLENKIESFSESISKKINAEHEEKLKCLADEISMKTDTLIKSYEERKVKILEETEKVLNEKKISINAKEKTDTNREVLKLQQKFAEDIMLELNKKVKNYVNSDEYIVTLPKTIASFLNALEVSEYNVYLTNKDLDRLEADILISLSDEQKSKVTLCPSKIDILGGFIIENKQKTFRVDNSLLSIVESKNELIGLEISKVFKTKFE